MKRRLLRISLIALVLVLFTGYFTFSTLLFSPLESDYEGDLSNLIPRDVDFYVSKARLVDDFDPLPRPRFADDFLASAGGQALQREEGFAELLERLDATEALAELDAVFANLPIEAEPLGVFGGRDLAVAGYFRGGRVSDADWAVYGRGNWIAKLGTSLLEYPDWIGLPAQGITATQTDRIVALEGGQLPRPLFVTRVFDVVVIGTTRELVAKALELEAARGQNSFGQSAKYHDNVTLSERKGSALELYVDYTKLSVAMGWTGALPDPNAEALGTAVMARLFQFAFIRELIGTATFGRGMTLSLNGILSSEGMNTIQKRLYRARGVERVDVLDVARLAPADAGLFALLRLSLGDVLREALAATDADTRSLIDDQVREVWGYADAQPLIDEIDAAFQDRVAIVVRNHDYPDEGEFGPPHNDRATLTWAVVLWIQDEKAVDSLEKKIQSRSDAFGVRGRKQGEAGVYENKDMGGGAFGYEYWNQLIDGTGHIATMRARYNRRNAFLISNHNLMLGHLNQTYLDLDGTRHANLADYSPFLAQVNAGLQATDLSIWANPRAVGDTLRKLARQSAGESVVINWDVERPRIEKELIAEHFPGETWGRLSPDVEERLARLYDAEALRFEQEFASREVPDLLRASENRIQAWEILSGVLLQLAIDTKGFDLYARFTTPFEPADL